MWMTQALEIADTNGRGIGRWRLTACSDEGGGGPFGDTSHDHASAQEAQECERCDEFCARMTGFPSRHQQAADQEARERREYERLKAKFDPPPPAPPPIQSLDEQFAALAQKYPGARMERAEVGGVLITLPDVQLPPGYDKSSCTVLFYVPAGYPFANPMWFWTDQVRLASGGFPTVTLTRDSYADGYGVPKDFMRWGWVVQSWDPRQNTLKTYASVIARRLSMVE